MNNLPTVIIRVPFSSKGVNHMAYLTSCMVCATVSLTVVPSFSDITDVSTIGHSFKTDRSCIPLFHVAQYGDDIIGRELNLRKLPGRQWESNPQPSEQLRQITIKTSASTETATAAYMPSHTGKECKSVKLWNSYQTRHYHNGKI